MAETTADVRRDIELTRERMSSTLAELEQKLNVAQVVRDHPWPTLALAFGAGVLLSGSGADVKTAAATATATKGVGSKVASALDDIVAAMMRGVHQALDDRINGWVELYRDALGFAVRPALTLDHSLGQCLAHPIQNLRAGCVLKTRQRRLRSERGALQRITIKQRLVNRIAAQPRCVVTVGVAAGNREYSLPNQIMQRVRDLARLAFIVETRGDAFGQLQPLIARLEQHRAAVRAAVRLIELRHQRLLEQLRKHDTLSCGTFSHAKVSWLVHYALSQERMYQPVRPLYIQVRE